MSAQEHGGGHGGDQRCAASSNARTGAAAQALSGWRGRGFEGPARGGRWGEAWDSARTDGHAAPRLRARAVREGEGRVGASRVGEMEYWGQPSSGVSFGAEKYDGRERE
ncbi:hypothetical protein GQ55_9G140300 [Panicum hallii var. hallii]|uniref:Uncharacterized protein n=1 Tax=Panicum hallii var. hallii TaxID=1504633 RepID=A0A2T7C2Z5_9POAL|nr:hypothetical protein GQ55_9G140300 [Panicum hallii var. hallii]